MNTLILGAIFLVALLAIVGIIWLAMGERQGSGKAPAAAPATNGNEQARKQASAPSMPPMAGAGKAEGGTATAKGAPSVPPQREEMVAVPSDEQAFPALDGQFYELAAQLRALHREVQDIERRLNTLTAIVNRIEREYGEVGVEAE